MKKITIAIDGHSSTGKSTAAKQLAEQLQYIYVDTGAMYRAVALFVIQQGWHKDGSIDQESLLASLDKIKIHFEYNKDTDKADVFLNGKNVETAIRTLAVSNLVSHVAVISEVRALLVKQQQAMGAQKGIVMDGRDIGTVVFPDAELKVFMTAAPEVRAQRRYDELVDRGDKVIYDEVYQNVIQRDHIDSTRADSPLVQAEDALLLDTSEMSRKEQFDLLFAWAEERIQQEK
jgi:cytidylate kinase (EC 2.7.4.14)